MSRRLIIGCAGLFAAVVAYTSPAPAQMLPCPDQVEACVNYCTEWLQECRAIIPAMFRDQCRPVSVTCAAPSSAPGIECYGEPWLLRCTYEPN